MLYLLQGEDTYRSRKKLLEIVAQYRAKIGASYNLERIDAGDGDVTKELGAALEAGSLFVRKKLIVIEYALSHEGNFAFLVERLGDVEKDPDVIVVLWERGLGKDQKKRVGQIEKLLSDTQEFAPLEGVQLRRWIEKEAGSRGAQLFPAHWTRLAAKGSDLWAIANELDKYSVSPSADLQESIREEHTLFELGDFFFVRRREALKILLSLLEQGEDAFGIFSYLANHTRTLLTVKAYLDMKKPVAKEHGIHPFVAKKAGIIVRNISVEELQQRLGNFFEEDWRIKTGQSTPEEALTKMLL